MYLLKTWGEVELFALTALIRPISKSSISFTPVLPSVDRFHPFIFLIRCCHAKNGRLHFLKNIKNGNTPFTLTAVFVSLSSLTRPLHPRQLRKGNAYCQIDCFLILMKDVISRLKLGLLHNCYITVT